MRTSSLLTALLMASALTLAACGGGGDDAVHTPAPPASSATTPSTPASGSASSASTPAGHTGTCVDRANGSDAYAIPQNESCTLSHPKFNAGAAVTFSCTADGKLKGKVGVISINSDKSYTHHGFTLTCKA